MNVCGAELLALYFILIRDFMGINFRLTTALGEWVQPDLCLQHAVMFRSTVLIHPLFDSTNFQWHGVPEGMNE